MKATNLTIGGIWKDSRSGKEFELAAQNKESGQLQLSSIDGEQSFKCMSEASMLRHYKLIALSLKAYRPEAVETVTTQVEEAEVPEASVAEPTVTKVVGGEVVVQQETEVKTDKVKKAIKKFEGVKVIHKVQLADGTIVSGLTFLKDTAGVVQADTWKTHSPIWYLMNKGADLLTLWNAKLVAK
jgi:hypothetical protein